MKENAVKELVLTRTTTVWALLVTATMLSWALGHGAGTGESRVVGSSILLIAFVKVRFVVLEFMEIRGAPTWLRLMLHGWMVVCCAVLIALLNR